MKGEKMSEDRGEEASQSILKGLPSLGFLKDIKPSQLKLIFY